MIEDAAEDLRYLLSGDDYGPVTVTAGKGTLRVHVGGRHAALDVKAYVGGAYEGYPVVIQSGTTRPATASRKGILTVYPDPC